MKKALASKLRKLQVDWIEDRQRINIYLPQSFYIILQPFLLSCLWSVLRYSLVSSECDFEYFGIILYSAQFISLFRLIFSSN